MKAEDTHRAYALFEAMRQEAGASFVTNIDDAGNMTATETHGDMGVHVRVAGPTRVHMTLTDLDPPTALRVAKLLGEILPALLLLLCLAAPSHAAGLDLLCLADGTAPQVAADVIRDPQGATNDSITCRSDSGPTGAMIACPCKDRRPKPTRCYLLLTVSPYPEDGLTYAACGYTDQAHPKRPTFGVAVLVQP